MEIDSGLANVHEIATYPATAHVSGYFPEKICGGCVSFDPASKKSKGRCIKHFEMRGEGYKFERDREGNRKEDWWRGLRTIPSETLACKYFVAAPETDIALDK